MILNRKTTSITAGDLKDRLTLLMPSATSNGRGGSTTTYSDYSEVWCKAIPANSSRELAESQLTFYDAFVFTIRYSSVPITADWHITFKDRTYTIHTLDNIESRNQYWRILAYSKNL
jgi:SPP1 family predicted phage head-tail adaptor